MVSVLASSAVDRGFEPPSGQAKDYLIGICCFSAKHTALRRKSKYWLARNQDNVSEWGDMSIRGLLFQWTSTIPIQLSVLVYYYKADIIIEYNLFSPWYSWKIAELALNNNHSFTLLYITHRLAGVMTIGWLWCFLHEFKVVPYTSGKIWSARLIFLMFWQCVWIYPL